MTSICVHDRWCFLHYPLGLHPVCGAPTQTLTATFIPDRYQLDFVDAEFATLTVDQHVAHARTAQQDDLRAYVARGGLPPVIGEWALAGTLPLRCGRHSGLKSCDHRLTKVFTA